MRQRPRCRGERDGTVSRAALLARTVGRWAAGAAGLAVVCQVFGGIADFCTSEVPIDRDVVLLGTWPESLQAICLADHIGVVRIVFSNAFEVGLRRSCGGLRCSDLACALRCGACYG